MLLHHVSLHTRYVLIPCPLTVCINCHCDLRNKSNLKNSIIVQNYGILFNGHFSVSLGCVRNHCYKSFCAHRLVGFQWKLQLSFSSGVLQFVGICCQGLIYTTSSALFYFQYNQQDATLYIILYYCQCSICFRRFLRPLSGAQKLYKQHPVWQAFLLLPLVISHFLK